MYGLLINTNVFVNLKTFGRIMTGQSLQIQAEIYVYMLPVTRPSLRYLYVSCWEYDV